MVAVVWWWWGAGDTGQGRKFRSGWLEARALAQHARSRQTQGLAMVVAAVVASSLGQRAAGDALASVCGRTGLRALRCAVALVVENSQCGTPAAAVPPSSSG